MAKAQATDPVYKQVLVQDGGITLELSNKEAAFLLALLGECVVGPATGPRGISDGIHNALCRVVDEEEYFDLHINRSKTAEYNNRVYLGG